MKAIDSLAVRVFVLLLLGIVAAAGSAFAVSSMEARARERAEWQLRLEDRILDAAAFLAGRPAALTGPDRLGVGPEALWILKDGTTAGVLDDVVTAGVNQRLGALASVTVSKVSQEGCAPPAPTDLGPPREAADPPPPPPPPPPGGVPPGGSCRRVSLMLANGARFELLAPSGPTPPAPRLPLGPGPLLVVGIIAAGLAWVVAILVTAPVARLGGAALALGQNLERPPLALEGPQEVRKAAAAFNTMQTHLRQLMAERTQMLAAITHDLQTPLTRQRLRIDKVADPDLRDDLLADQEAMRVLIREGLDLARASHDGEPLVGLEVDSLLDSLADDAKAAGHSVEVTRYCGCVLLTRPQALSRCLSNLLGNAANYAGHAELAAEATADGVTIRVLDRGPGLPSGDVERLFEPFTRGETSRSRETGGVGLGLTIARMLAERSGGHLTLHRRTGGGLEARVVLRSSRVDSA